MKINLDQLKSIASIEIPLTSIENQWKSIENQLKSIKSIGVSLKTSEHLLSSFF